jgi:lysophospholipase L1-like esterase
MRRAGEGGRPAFWPAGLALVAMLLGSETLVREWIQSPSAYAFDPRFGVLQRPGARIVQSQEGWSVSRVNALGFMDDELRNPRPRLRVLLLGDSYTEGLQVARGRNFSHVAERALPGVEIVNVGRSAAFPADYAAELASFDRLVGPDLIVVQVNDGDVREMLNPALMAEARREAASAGAPAPPAAGRGTRPGRWLLSHSALANFGRIRFAQLVEKERTRLSNKLGIGGPRYVERTTGPVDPRAAAILDSLYRVMRGVPRPIVFVYIPNLDYFASPPAPRYPERREFYRAFAARNGVPLVDPTDAMLEAYRRTRQPLQGFQNSVLGTGHLNARGHAVVGRLLAGAIRGAVP